MTLACHAETYLLNKETKEGRRTKEAALIRPYGTPVRTGPALRIARGSQRSTC
jgi:hypothetical protein